MECSSSIATHSHTYISSPERAIHSRRWKMLKRCFPVSNVNRKNVVNVVLYYYYLHTYVVPGWMRMGFGRLVDWSVRVCGIIYNFGVFIYHNWPNYIVSGIKLNIHMYGHNYVRVCEQWCGWLADGHLDLTVYRPNDMWNVHGENKCNMNLILIKL